MVALTDGARSIRAELTALFGREVTLILDWYHLEKRVYEHLAMMAHSKTEREGWERTVLGCLWRGQVEEALTFVRGLSARRYFSCRYWCRSFYHSRYGQRRRCCD